MIVRELFAKIGFDVDAAGFEKAEALIKGAKLGLIGLVAGAGAVAVGLVELAQETANAGLDAYKLSQRLGVTTDAAQELAYAATATGADVGSLETAMFHMSRTLDMAKEGSAEAQKALGGLGVPLQKLLKMKPDEQFQALAGGLSEVKDQSQFASKAQAVFGRGARDISVLLKKGAEGIQEFREEAHEMGLVLSEETIKDAREWKVQSRLAGEAIEALKFKVGAFILHGLVAMRRAWIQFKKDHAEQIIRGITYAVVGLTAMTVVYGFANAGALGAAVLNWLAVGAAAVGAGLRAAAAWLATIAPIAAAAVGVIFLGLAFEDVYHFFQGDKASLIGKVIKTWKEDIHSFADAVKAVSGTLGQIFGTTDVQNSFLEHYNKQHGILTPEEKASQAADARRRQRGQSTSVTGAPPDLVPFLDPAAAFSPGAAQPRVVPAGSGAVPVSQFSAEFNITAAPGMDSKELAGQVRTVLDDWHRTKTRERVAAVE